MQRLIGATGLALLIGLGTMDLSPVLGRERVHPHIVRSKAFPAHANVPFATYRITVGLGSSPVEQLVIGLPATVQISSGITVEEPGGIAIPATATYEGQQAILTFEPPLVPGRRVVVNLNGVKNSLRVGQVLTFPLSAKEPGKASLVQFDTARIHLRTP